MNNIETLQWFDNFYKKNKKLVDVIIKDNKKQMIEYNIPDVWARCFGENKEIKGYRIKGYTKFNWDELMRIGTTLEIVTLNGIPQVVYCNSNYYPGISYIGEKQYLTEQSLKRLRDVFTRLIINLKYYKKYSKEGE